MSPMYSDYPVACRATCPCSDWQKGSCGWLLPLNDKHQQRGNFSIGNIIITLSELGSKSENYYITIPDTMTPVMLKIHSI